MDRVAAAAGVSKATVYSHFKDKEGLFTALVQRLNQQKLSLFHQVKSLDGNPQIALSQFLSTALDRIQRDRDHIAFIRLIIGESGRFPQLAQIFVQNMTKLGIALLSEFLADRPDLNISDPQATAHIIMGAMVHYVLVQEMLHGGDIVPMDGDRLVKAIVELVTGNQRDSTL